jgi:cysteine synthase A
MPSTDWNAYAEPLPSLLEAVGRTPLVRLNRVAPEGVELLAKVEWYGPTGSVKDRIYRRMIERAEARGDLKAGMTIIECTTGNAGIACSAVAAIKGYPCTIVMPEGMSEERKRMIAAYGAELVLTPGSGTDIDLALERMHQIVEAEPSRYFFPGEFENPDNPEAQEASGEEIWEQTGGALDAVVASHGTGGWISGAARALKRHDPEVRAYAVEPAECPLISEQRWGTHGVPGIGDGIVPENLDLALMDGIVTVSTEEALETARRLARDEGLLCGPSSGINVAAALKVAAKHPGFERIVTLIPDTGQRYLSGELLGEGPAVEEPERDHAVDPASLARIEANRHRLEFIS